MLDRLTSFVIFLIISLKSLRIYAIHPKNNLVVSNARRITLLLFLSINLAGCMTLPFEESVEHGMEKKRFIDNMRTFGFGRYESIYFNQKKGIEILIPRIELHDHYSWKVFRFNDDEPQLVIFNKVTEPLPYYTTIDPELFQEFCNEWNPAPLRCAYYGDGVLRRWFSEEELSQKVTLGDDDAKLLLSALQLRYEFVDNVISQTMQNNQMTEADARETLFWSEFHRDRDHTKASLESAKRETAQYKQYAYINNAEKNKSSPQSQSYDYYDSYYEAFGTESSQSTQSSQVSSKVENSMGSLFGRLIEAVLDAYIDEKLGLNTSNSSLSKSDLEKIEEASRRGMRRATKQQKGKDKTKWTAPIGY